MKPCPLYPDIGYLFVDPQDLGDGFVNSHAFAVFGEGIDEPFIIIDRSILDEDWCSLDHILVIMAHELGHILSRSEDEELADLLGMTLLYSLGYEDAHDLHRAEY
ncbi:MAG: hypothetical protein QGG40_21800, partial [Myxococcota bacterium]|nr:hypothetical protein [Myxococcota bacterium]